jgi:hypothetical protein
MTEATKPFSEEMPHELLRTFRADPSSAYAAEWRDFVTMIWAPGVAKLAAIMDAHQSVMELPPMEWCEANFPAFSWEGTYIEWPVITIRAYAAFFDVLIAQWERGNIETVRPSMLSPLTAVIRYVEWSGAAAQEKLQELIGMTTVTERHAGDSTHYAVSDIEADRAVRGRSET